MFKNKNYIIGLDEVGRGTLAGPVVVCAVAIHKGLKIQNKKLGELKDSKKLSSSQREKWVEYFKNHPEIIFTVARVYERKIEKINISCAANLAALRAYRLLVSRFKIHASRVVLDGGLYLGSRKLQMANKFASTIIKGDEKIPVIAIASILAKVYRDKFMVRLAKKYPEYGLDLHKGYGTKIHLAAIKNFGPAKIHRLTFISRYLKIKTPSI